MADGRARSAPVSVITPAYNHEQFIAATLDSILKEGYPNLEIVLVDDGSTDRTWAVVEEWREKNADRIRMVATRQENRGLTRTLNGLLHRASGDFVTMLASDDRLVAGGIAARVEFLEAHPDLSAVFADCRVIDAGGGVIGLHGTGSGSRRARQRMMDDPGRSIVEHWSVPGPVLLYRREAILGIGGYDESLELEDWDLYLRLAARDAIGYLDRVVAEYRWHGDNTVARPEHAATLADELRGVAMRSRHLFRGHLYLELVHESASWGARAAWLRRRWSQWAAWRLLSVVLKLIALAVPRRPSDQKLAAARQ